jgi:RNA polymerase sigma factor (sigma-70 family)
LSDFSPTLTADLLLTHERFVRGVARDLLRDPHAADDAVQDTWLQALQHGPRSLATLRSWLGRVVSNRARDARRASVRRQRREAAAMAGVASESVGDTAARLAMQRDVVGAVLALTEPYRSVVLLRYYHGLEPIEIAARLGSKAATVRTQLVRAHDQLRERLDRDHGGRAAWAAVLLPAPATLSAPSAASIATRVVAVTTLAALATMAYFAWRIDDPVPPAQPAAAAAAIEAPVDTTVPDRTPAPAAPPPLIAQQAATTPPGAIPEVIAVRAVLREQNSNRGYGSSGFSFLHAYGGVGSSGKDKARGDCDVVLQRRRFRADSVTDDRSLIVDLGNVPLPAFVRVGIDEHVQRVRGAAEKHYVPNDGKGARPVMLAAELGHTYFVWTNDTDSDHAALFEVVDLSDDTCTLEWYWTEDGTWARGSLKSPPGARSLAAAIIAMRDAVRPAFMDMREQEVGPLVMRNPRVVLQARTSHKGGNPCRIDIGRGHTQYFDRISREPIALPSPIGDHDDAIGHCSGGLIPDGMKFIVTHVTWSGQVQSDSGHGRFHVQLGDQELVKVAKADQPIAGSWTGRIELVRGEEGRAFFEVAYFSQGEVVFTGAFEKLEK